VLRVLASMPPRSAVPVEELARTVRLSPGRLMHAFEESVGIPLRPYLLWLKLQRAGAAIVAGAPLSAAAHAAGFADSAHMTRTFRRMLGGTPTAIGGSVQPRASRAEAPGAPRGAAARQARVNTPPNT
jgi:AraC-like DNA-binding protein